MEMATRTGAGTGTGVEVGKGAIMEKERGEHESSDICHTRK